MDSLIRVWPVLVAMLFFAFMLGGYAFMIRFLNEKIRVLFQKAETHGGRIIVVETNNAVIAERTANLVIKADKQNELLMTLLSEIRGRA